MNDLRVTSILGNLTKPPFVEGLLSQIMNFSKLMLVPQMFKRSKVKRNVFVGTAAWPIAAGSPKLPPLKSTWVPSMCDAMPSMPECP